MGYTLQKYIMISLLAVFVLMSFGIGFLNEHKEIYPVYSWSLFSKIISNKYDYDLMITWKEDPSEYNSIFIRKEELLLNHVEPITLYEIIQAIGWDYEQDQVIEKNKYEKLRSILGPSMNEFRFVLISRSYDSLDYRKTGEYESRHLLELEL